MANAWFAIAAVTGLVLAAGIRVAVRATWQSPPTAAAFEAAQRVAVAGFGLTLGAAVLSQAVRA